MAIKKHIESDSGITVEYHRIVYLQKITNKCNIIQVASYPTESKRIEEEQAISEGRESELNIYIEKSLIRTDYNENMTIYEAYEHLKTLDIFSGAEDC